jgi:hypothetical protein
MRHLLYALLLAVTAVSVRAQDTKLGDAYGVAAVRAVIQFESDWDKAGQLLIELEAQISSPAEQASYDNILAVLKTVQTGQRRVNDAYDYCSQPNTMNTCKWDAWKAANAAYAASIQPCFTALKTNLKRRDGTVPQECKRDRTTK